MIIFLPFLILPLFPSHPFFLCLLCILYFNPPIIFLSLHSLEVISIIPLFSTFPSLFLFPSSRRVVNAETDKTVELISNSLPRQRNRITFIKGCEPAKSAKTPAGMSGVGWDAYRGTARRFDSNRPAENLLTAVCCKKKRPVAADCYKRGPLSS